MRRRRRRLARILIALLVLGAVFMFRSAFNGKLVFFTLGFDKRTLFEAGSQKTYDYEAKVLFSDIRLQYEALFGDDVWSRDIDGMNFESYAKEQVKTKLIRVAYMNELANERGVVLNRDEAAKVSKAAGEYLDSLTQEQKDGLDVTQADMEAMYAKFAIASRLYTDMTVNIRPEISADRARVIKIQYISADTREEIDSAMERIEAGENFFYVAREINRDAEYEYELKRGETVKEFEDEAYDLATGEISGIVPAGEKYYIIKCISDNEKAKTEANKNSILESVRLEEFNKAFEPYEGSVYLNFNEKMWERLNLTELQSSVVFENIFIAYFGN